LLRRHLQALVPQDVLDLRVNVQDSATFHVV
jgi:hypothetical protein